MVKTTINRTFKKNERDYNDYESFFKNRFHKFYRIGVWKKIKEKDYSKGKFEIGWVMLREKDQFKNFNMVN